MPSLFFSDQLAPLTIPGANVSYMERLDLGQPAQDILALLTKEIEWQHQDVVIRGKAYKQPRLTAWYGEPGTSYRYSGLSLEPLPWTDLLSSLKARVEAEVGCTFNSALLNLYRGNRDSIGFHSDNEPELGPEPTIASLSLGQERTFILRPKRDKKLQTQKITLGSGSLLVMAGATQDNWLHGIEKEEQECGARINITFRTIHAQARSLRRIDPKN